MWENRKLVLKIGDFRKLEQSKFWKSKKTISDLIWPIVLAIITLIVPVGTEWGEELTNVPSSTLIALATLGLSIAVFVMWFIKKNSEEEQEEEISLYKKVVKTNNLILW